VTRHLISLIDGTQVSATQNDSYSNYSNVYELAHLLQLKDKSEDGRPQIVFYTSGISSQPGTRDYWALATGEPIMAQILDQYTNLCSNYEFENYGNDAKADKIYLFGFSRGAMAARALAGLITEFGLLKPRDIRLAPQILDRWQAGDQPPDTVEMFRVEVEFIGVFDSVMGGLRSWSVFNPIRFPHHRLSRACKAGVHILAVDENRRFFENVSWSGHTRGSEDGTFRQIWMPGVHSDVGGTADEFWGRASFLAMAHYIDTRTRLQLDSSWLNRKRDRLKSAFDNGAYHIRQHRLVPPFSLARKPLGSAGASEYYHPIIDRISNTFDYNDKKNFEWRKNRFAAGFQEVTVDSELVGYFDEFL
jgi:uncharacterized protein (DUF2235 family)